MSVPASARLRVAFVAPSLKILGGQAVQADSLLRAWRDDPSSPERHAAARPALAAWRDELLYSYPREGERLFAAHLGTVGDLLPYAYPLFRIPVEASRAVAVHDAFLVDAIRGDVPGARVAVVPMPVEPTPVAAEAVARLRADLGFDAPDVVVATFGLVTPEKRLSSLARVVAAGDPRLRLLVVGPVPDRAAVDAVLAASGAVPRTVVTSRVPLEALAVHAAAADIVVHLRWPTGRETSAALLRVLGQGRPTIVSDLAHQAGLPDEAVWRVDPADEEASLARAVRALADDPLRRERMGRAAEAYAAAYAKDPSGHDAAFAHGQALLMQKRAREAERIFEAMIRDHPESAAPLAELARCRVEQNDFNGALDWYRKAIEREPWTASLHENAAMVLSALERHEEAIAEVGEALRFDPESPRVRESYATISGRAARAAGAR